MRLTAGVLACRGVVFCPSLVRSDSHERSTTIEHTVEAGETLWSIAAQSDIYADPYLWPVIYKFNRDQITDPARIYPSQTLQIPIDIDEETRKTARSEAGAEEQ